MNERGICLNFRSSLELCFHGQAFESCIEPSSRLSKVIVTMPYQIAKDLPVMGWCRKEFNWLKKDFRIWFVPRFHISSYVLNETAQFPAFFYLSYVLFLYSSAFKDWIVSTEWLFLYSLKGTYKQHNQVPPGLFFGFIFLLWNLCCRIVCPSFNDSQILSKFCCKRHTPASCLWNCFSYLQLWETL